MTAVQWLEIELSELECTKNERSLSLHLDLIYETFQEALQMEREQIVESFMEGTKMDNINDELSARFNACIYYGEKFGENYGGQDE